MEETVSAAYCCTCSDKIKLWRKMERTQAGIVFSQTLHGTSRRRKTLEWMLSPYPHPFGVVWINFADELQFLLLGECAFVCVCARCHRQQAARSHLSGLYHPASGATVLTVLRLKHPVSFPASLAPPVREKETAEIWIALAPPSELIIGLGLSNASLFHGGPRNKPPKRPNESAMGSAACCTCVVKPLFQSSSKGDAWPDPFSNISLWMCVVFSRCWCVSGCVCSWAPALRPGDIPRWGVLKTTFSNWAIRQLSEVRSGSCTVGSFP